MFAWFGKTMGSIAGSILGWIGNPFNWLALWFARRAGVMKERMRHLKRIFKTLHEQLKIKAHKRSSRDDILDDLWNDRL
jgi:hypothetical protein